MCKEVNGGQDKSTTNPTDFNYLVTHLQSPGTITGVGQMRLKSID